MICDTLVTFTTDEKIPDDMARMITARSPAFLVALAGDGALEGFATYGAFRSGPGYQFTREHSVILSSSARGRGTGRLLMGALEKVAYSENVKSLVAGISAENPDGIAFHRKIGFDSVGQVAKAGFKSGQWIDLLLMQKFVVAPH